ncbi:hypothetical protein O1611_g1950 [Lasiodiplodia mahajangana]|uniref:Uncharacterized protein n=1 Tax=Lasiodiplodia mahajangana TaxID=1108764 RepID=A0ACC2JVY0_9PEZI|nr:hypothetical protein O1611_g1950 [Lasiodiplodia mahajangana]
MTSHYPLNGVDLDFRRYAHRPFEGRDVLISRIVEDFFNSRRVSPRTYHKFVGRPRGFGHVKSQDRELGLDMQVMWRLLELDWPDQIIPLQAAIIQLVQAHYFERDPLIHQAMKCFSYRNHDPKTASNWRQDMVAHLALFQKVSLARHRFSLFSGNSQLSCNEGPYNGRLSLGSCFVTVPWVERRPNWQREVRRSEFWPASGIFHHQVPTRSQSLPPDGSWGIATPSPKYGHRRGEESILYVAFFPLKPLSELDKLSRRRSLSRSHIRAMFKDKPEWIIKDTIPNDPQIRPKYPCSNCGQLAHKTKDCLTVDGKLNVSSRAAIITYALSIAKNVAESEKKGERTRLLAVLAKPA